MKPTIFYNIDKSHSRAEKLKKYFETQLAMRFTASERQIRWEGIMKIFRLEKYLSTKSSKQLYVIADQLSDMNSTDFDSEIAASLKRAQILEGYEYSRRLELLRKSIRDTLAVLNLREEELNLRIKMIINIVKLSNPGNKCLPFCEREPAELINTAFELCKVSMKGLEVMDLISKGEEEERKAKENIESTLSTLSENPELEIREDVLSVPPQQEKRRALGI